MNKLSEIEATNNVLATGASRPDVELLIRAVRQLGAGLMEHLREEYQTEDRLLVFEEFVIAEWDIDPDVLELIKEANGC